MKDFIVGSKLKFFELEFTLKESVNFENTEENNFDIQLLEKNGPSGVSQEAIINGKKYMLFDILNKNMLNANFKKKFPNDTYFSKSQIGGNFLDIWIEESKYQTILRRKL